MARITATHAQTFGSGVLQPSDRGKMAARFKMAGVNGSCGGWPKMYNILRDFFLEQGFHLHTLKYTSN